MQITITVTEDHVKRGVPQDGANCPIALAVIDAMLGDAGVSCVNSVSVTQQSVDYYGVPTGEEELQLDVYGYRDIVLPDEYLAFANNFDNGEPLTLPPPITIELEPCEMVQPYSEDVGDNLPF